MPKFFPNLIAQEISKDPTCYFMTRIFYFTVCVISHSVMSDSVPPWTAARQAPLSVGFSRQEYCSGLPCPPPGGLPDPGIKPESLNISCIGRRVLYH